MAKRGRVSLKTIGKIACAAAAALLIIAYATGFTTRLAPFTERMVYDSPAQAVMAGDRVYVIDQASMRVSCAESDQILWTLTGNGKREGEFYKAQNIAVDDSGNLYLHNIVYDDMGVLITREEVLLYDLGGNYVSTVYSVPYDSDGYQPANNGNFCGLKAWGDELYIIERRDNAAVLTLIKAGAKFSSVVLVAEGIGGRAMNMTVDADGVIYYTDKIGSIRRLSARGVEDYYLPETPPSGELGVIPFGIDALSDGSLLITDIGRRRILRLAPGAGEAEIVVSNSGDDVESLMATPLRYTVCASGDSIVTTDAESVEVFNLTTGELAHISTSATLPLAQRLTQLAGWVGTGLAGICLLGLAGYLIIFRIIKNPDAVVGRIGLAVALLVLLTSLLVGDITISDGSENISAEFEKQIEYVARLIDEQVDGDLLEKIDASSDIETEEYREFKRQLDVFIDTAYASDYGLYYLIYRELGGLPCVVADAENNLPCVYPQIVGELFDISYSGEYGVDSNYVDAYGVWAFAGGPLHNSAGDVVGVVEVGVNMHSATELRREQTFNLILNIATMLVLFILIMGEALVFYGYMRKRRAAIGGAGLESVLRTIMFLLFAAQCMQDSFIPVLAIKLYKPVFGLPESVGGALPITLEMLTLAIFSLVGGSILSKVKIKPMLLSSLMTALVGFAISAFAPDFYILMLGKAIIGAGVGLTYVTINTAVATIPDPARGEEMFGEINAGMIAGCQFGLGVGAYLYGAFSYRGSYLASSAIILLAGLAAILLVGKTQFIASARKAERGGISMLSFLFRRKTLAFFLFSIIPALVAVSFFDYYFPIFGDSQALSETRIGQIMLLNGIMAIYTGPTMTRWLLRKIGAKPSAIIVAALFACGLFAFALAPSVATMVALSLFFGLITGFSYSVQTAYFSRMQGFAEYGESRALGLYAMFQSIAQSFAPLIIGGLFMGGMTRGIIIIAAGVGASGLLFMLLSAGRMRQRRY